MKIRIVTTSNSTLYGSLLGEEAQTMSPQEALYWVMNNDTKFIRYLLNKNAILNIAEDTYD
jgi:hypothetical protein